MDKKKIDVPRATLDFLKYEENGLVYYEFNATECQPPEPMVNAMYGMDLLKKDNDRVVGIFFHEPTPLYEKIDSKITYEAIELENGDFKIIFKLK